MGRAQPRARATMKFVRQLPFWALLSSLLLAGCGKEETKVSDSPERRNLGQKTNSETSTDTSVSTPSLTQTATATATSTSSSTSTNTDEEIPPPPEHPDPPKEDPEPPKPRPDFKSLPFIGARVAPGSAEPAAPGEVGPGKTPHAPNEFRMPEFEERWGLKQDIYEKAVRSYAAKRSELNNPRFVTVIDFSKTSSQKRLFLFDLAMDRMNSFLTTHGMGSDPRRTGLASSFSNTGDSNKSSLGHYVTMGTYIGKHGYSLRLRGLDATNDKAINRLIVVHAAKYVDEKKGVAGRSHGCFALDPNVTKALIDRIKGGSLVLADK